MFVLSIVLGILGLLALAFGLLMLVRKPQKIRVQKKDRYGYKIDEWEEVEGPSRQVAGRWTALGGALGLLLALMFLIFSSFYTQEAGEAKVLRDWTGNIVGSETTSGGHWKEPWVDTVDWNIRNQQVMFAGDGSTTHEGQEVAGAQITFTDKDGVTGNLDISVIYSISASKVEDLTFDYSDQDDFRLKVVENDVKSLPRDILATYTTIRAYNDRSEVRAKIEEALTESWEDLGVTVERVQLQGLRYPADIEQRFIDTQNAQTELIKAETDAKTAKTKADGEAQAAISKATGEAEANRILDASLSDKVLQQRWIEAVGKSGTIIVPENFTSLGSLVPQGGGQ